VRTGIVFGLAAALCWGTADYCARGAARTGGTLRTLLYVELIATVGLLVLGVPLGLVRIGRLPMGAVLAAIALNLVILAGAGLLYRAFAVGTLALVSPIAASYAAITALLALTLSGEHPRPGQLVGIVLALCGVILASSAPGHHTMTPKHRVAVGPLQMAPGLVEAIAAMLVFGVAYWGLRYVVPVLGGVTVAFLGKASDLAAIALMALWLLPRRPADPTSEPTYVLSRPSGLFLRYVVPVAVLDRPPTCSTTSASRRR
jgi:drug/metabolite transporter (DMT)-like permease